MISTIAAFTQDDDGDWVARLSCGHGQHMRHRPMLEYRPWVLDAAQRAARIGTPIECPLCDRAEMPGDLVRTYVSDPLTCSKDASDFPSLLEVPPGQWYLIEVLDGQLKVYIPQLANPNFVLGPRTTVALPPSVTAMLEPRPGTAAIIESWSLPAFGK